MASTLVVPPSKHTLFMRGFSSHQDIDRIRDFFKRESGGGECTVEFFKESDTREKLFVALRFENREAAKDILSRYDSTEVLGDRITIAWFKDLRRARQKGLIPSYNNNYKNNYADSGGKPFYYNNNLGKPGFRGRFQHPDAAEEERRRVTARGVSPLRNGFRPGQFKSYRDGEKEPVPTTGTAGTAAPPTRGRSRAESWKRLSSGGGTPSGNGSRRRTDSSMSRSNSRSRSRSYSNSRSRSPRTDGSRTPSRDRSNSPQQSRSSHKAHSPDARDSRSGDNQDGGRDDKAHWSPDRYSANDRLSERRNHTSHDRSPAGSGAKWSRESTSRDRSPISHKDHSPAGRQDADWERSPERSKYVRSTVKSVPERKSGEYEERYSPEPAPSYQKEKSETSAVPGSRGSWRPVDSRPRSPTHSSPPTQPAAQEYTRDYENRSSRRERMSSDHEVEVASKRSRDDHDRYSATDDVDNKRRRFQEDTASIPDQSPARSSKAGGEKERTWSGSKRSRVERSPEIEEVEKRKSTSTSSLTGVNGSTDIGALGLPHDKMILVREKKEEIERAYRQDCETFASVVKMLISKDPELEGRLQTSLRENLKEIGQRCIHELREFIEKLKTQGSGTK